MPVGCRDKPNDLITDFLIDLTTIDSVPLSTFLWNVGRSGKGSGGGGLVKKISYGEAPPQGLTPYCFLRHFWQKKYPFCLPFIDKMIPLLRT